MAVQSHAAVTERRVFPAWSITIPASFDETFVLEDGYWHAFDQERSISLTSMLLTDANGSPVPAELIAERFEALQGAPVGETPAGLLGWAVEADAIPPAKASRMLQGMLAVDGRVLIVTITADDRDWARGTWLSIRHHPGERDPSLAH